jgi:ApaG protein
MMTKNNSSTFHSMVTSLSQKIRITVQTEFLRFYQHPQEGQFLFAYYIHIENFRSDIVKLISRKWIICDSLGQKRIVEGDGVIGAQPVFEPGDEFQYESSVTLPNGFGTMGGYYIFENTNNGVRFKVSIPEFQLQVPYLLS